MEKVPLRLIILYVRVSHQPMHFVSVDLSEDERCIIWEIHVTFLDGIDWTRTTSHHTWQQMRQFIKPLNLLNPYATGSFYKMLGNIVDNATASTLFHLYFSPTEIFNIFLKQSEMKLCIFKNNFISKMCELPSLVSCGVESWACHPSYPSGRSRRMNQDSFQTWKFLKNQCVRNDLFKATASCSTCSTVLSLIEVQCAKAMA